MRNFFMTFALLLVGFVSFAQTTITHTIKRGETIESIAKQYGVSVAELEKSNPSIKDFFYVGMTINIPTTTTYSTKTTYPTVVSVKPKAADNTEKKSSTPSSDYREDYHYATDSYSKSTEPFFFRGSMDAAYHQMVMTTKVGNSSSTSRANGFSLGFRAMPTLSQNNVAAFYLGLDYECCFDSDKKTSNSGKNSSSAEYHSRYSDFKIPLGLQFNLPIAEKMCISPFIGLNFDILVTAKTRNKSSSTTYSYYGPLSYCNNIPHISYSNNTINYFDEKTMGDYAWKRFQIGWEVGLKIAIDGIVIEGTYSSCFTNIAQIEKTTMKMSGITVGLGFVL